MPPSVSSSPSPSSSHAPSSVPWFFPTYLNDGFIQPFAGATAGLVSGVMTCPLDVIKTKLQAQAGFTLRDSHNGASAILGAGGGQKGAELVYRGLVGTAKLIWTEEGVRGLYRGLGPLILGYLPTWMVYFTVYERAKERLEPEISKPWALHIVSSVTAGACSTICTNPIWVIKTRLMSQTLSPSPSSKYNFNHVTIRSPYHYNSTLDAARKMYAMEGIRSFYSGLGPALLGLVHVAVQFPLYEYFKSSFTGGVELGKQGEDGKVPITGVLSASCLSKVCASSMTYPHEVLRTRMQTQRVLNGRAKSGGGGEPKYKGIIHSARIIFREEGWRAFYAGMGTNMIRTVPASAVTLLTYEFVVGRLGQWRDEGRERERLRGEEADSWG